jgi:hypothetical protein
MIFGDFPWFLEIFGAAILMFTRGTGFWLAIWLPSTLWILSSHPWWDQVMNAFLHHQDNDNVTTGCSLWCAPSMWLSMMFCVKHKGWCTLV